MDHAFPGVRLFLRFFGKELRRARSSTDVTDLPTSTKKSDGSTKGKKWKKREYKCYVMRRKKILKKNS